MSEELQEMLAESIVRTAKLHMAECALWCVEDDKVSYPKMVEHTADYLRCVAGMMGSLLDMGLNQGKALLLLAKEGK